MTKKIKNINKKRVWLRHPSGQWLDTCLAPINLGGQACNKASTLSSRKQKNLRKKKERENGSKSRKLESGKTGGEKKERENGSKSIKWESG